MSIKQKIAKKGFKKIILKNGLRIILVPMKEQQTVTVKVLVETGSDHETKKENGISHFLEHMSFKGTDLRPNSKIISSEFDSIGSYSNAATSTEYTEYFAKAESKHASKLLNILSDIYLNSTYPKDEIEKEKGVVIEELNMYEDLPQDKVGEIMKKLLYGDTPAGRQIIGSKESLKSFSRKDIVSYKKKHYIAEKTVVVVSGNFDEKKITKEIEKAFKDIDTSGKIQKVKVKESQKKAEAVVHHKKIDQSHIIITFRSVSIHDKKVYALFLLSTILGKGMSSRLFLKMREELGLCYYIGASASHATDHGAFSFYSGVKAERTGEAITEILKEIEKIKFEKVDEEELQKAKDYRLGHFALGLESSDDYADYYGFQELDHENILSPEEHRAKIKAVTVDEIQNAAKFVFNESKMNLAIVGPYKDSSKFLPLLKLR